MIFCSLSCKDGVDTSIHSGQKESLIQKPTRLDSLEKISVKMYERNPVRSIPFYDEMANIYATQNRSVERAQTHLKLSNIYTDHTNDIKKASHHAHMALGIYEQLRDTVQMANLFGYCGYMSAAEGNVEFGKLQLNKAEQLYIGLNDQDGKTTTYFNMAKVFYIAREYQQSEKFLKLAKNYWTQKGDFVNVFSANNFAIKLFKELENASAIKTVIEENRAFLAKHKIDKALESAFVKLSEN